MATPSGRSFIRTGENVSIVNRNFQIYMILGLP